MTSAEMLLGMDRERKGRFGEAVCERVLASSGVTYIPLCRIQGGAPMAIATDSKTVLPDFDIAANGIKAYMDAKVKTQSIRFRKTGQVRHGINASNYQDYQAMGVLQSKQCGLFVVELLDESGNWSGSLLAESFAGLGEPHKGFNEPTPKVYWPRDRFAIIGAFSADELRAIANGHKQVDMAALLKMAFSAPPPLCESHFDRSLWIDEPPRRGWIRTVCRKCGVLSEAGP